MNEPKTYKFSWPAALYDKWGGVPLGIVVFVGVSAFTAYKLLNGWHLTIFGILFFAAIALTPLAAGIVRACTTDRFDPTMLELIDKGVRCFPRKREPYFISYDSVTRLHKPPPKMSREGATLVAEGLPVAEIHISEHFKDYDELIAEIAKQIPHAKLELSDLKQIDRSF